MKKILLLFFVLFSCSVFYAQNSKQTIDLLDWDKIYWEQSKDSIINDLKQNGWELEIEDRFYSITAKNPAKTITFCGIEVKSIMLMFSPWDDSHPLVGQSFSFKDKNEHDSFVDFFKIACKYSVKMYDYNLANENIRESEFFGYMGTNRFFFHSFDGYNLDGEKYFVHSLTVYKN